MKHLHDGVQHGFTLIELLVVIVIISVVSGIAVITLSSNQKRMLELTAKQIQQRILMAEQEALLRPAILGIAVTKTSLKWFDYNELSHWVLLTNRPFVPYYFMKQIDITLMMQDKIIHLSDQPCIIISMNGELTPFVLLLGEKNKVPTIKLIGRANGEVISEFIDA